MSFGEDIGRFIGKVEVAIPAVVERCGDIVNTEWVHGGPITGAPGQPVSQSGSPNDGELLASFTRTRDGTTDATSTDCRYAPDVEDNVNGFTFANGGAHGMKLVVSGFDNIVVAAVAEVAR